MIVPKSITHQHLFSVMHTFLQRSASPGASSACRERLRILDIGCGDGLLISYLQSVLELHYPESKIEIYGFDIDEMGYANSQQRPNTISLLERDHPNVSWSDRIKLQRVENDWDFPAEFFDVAFSNQVLEHVADLDHFLKNLKRVLKPNALSIHLFPLKHCIVEGHTDMPLAHRIRDYESRIVFARFMNRLGLSRYSQDREVLGYDDPEHHARDSASYLQEYTYYRSFGDFYRRCNELGLSLSSYYTKDFYFAKIRQLMRLAPVFSYRPWNWFLIEPLVSSVLSYAASITLTMTRMDYDIGERIRKEKAARFSASREHTSRAA